MLSQFNCLLELSLAKIKSEDQILEFGTICLVALKNNCKSLINLFVKIYFHGTYKLLKNKPSLLCDEWHAAINFQKQNSLELPSYKL